MKVPLYYEYLCNRLPQTHPGLRPQPRRPHLLTALGDALPRLLPPPPHQGHVAGSLEVAGGCSLDVTEEHSSAEQTFCDMSLSINRPDHAPCATPPDPPPLRTKDYTPCASPPDLPPSHPLRNKAVQDEIRLMRQGMRHFLQLKLQQRFVWDSDCV